MPHPEGPTLSDSDWPTVKIREEWKTGSRVLRRTIEIPEKIGYAVRGSRVKLELFLTSNDSMTITVFSNGSLVEKGDEDTQQAILLTENARRSPYASSGSNTLIPPRGNDVPLQFHL